MTTEPSKKYVFPYNLFSLCFDMEKARTGASLYHVLNFSDFAKSVI